jgi:hypothetical protein
VTSIQPTPDGSLLASHESPKTPAPKPSLAPDQLEHAKTIEQLVEGETKWDQRLIRWSNWLNPILVKETRQALKSKQFTWTLLVLTIVVLGWSVAAIVGMIPSIYYASNGSGLLFGYLVILVIPTFIIIPQAMFRSMASELDDGTFETLSLSSLSSSSILTGKLSVAVLQLVVYFSVIAPCIALTYLLRGVTLEVIAMYLLVIFSSSIALSTVAIVIASLSKSRASQVFFSIVLLVGQAIAAMYACGVLSSLGGTGILGTEAWTMLGVYLLVLIAYGWLLLRCGSSAIGVVSENRSTPIRVALLVVGLVFAMLCGFLAICFGDRNSMQEMIGVVTTFLFIHWGFAGSIMMGEQGNIPVRARRSLPSSLLGRVFLTWMNPGAGPGYLFVILSFAGSALTMAITPWLIMNPAISNIKIGSIIYSVALLSYLAMYLGIVRLLFLLVFKNMKSSRLLFSFICSCVLLVVSVLLTCSLSLAANDYQTMKYDWYCFPNMFWTLGDVFPDGTSVVWATLQHYQGLGCLGATALAVTLANVLMTTKDVVLLRIETPERVRKEKEKFRNKPETETDLVPVDPFSS